MGKTSAWLTSKVEEGNQAPKGVRLQLYGQMHNVHTHHCPCHGTDQLRSSLLSTLIQVISEAMDFLRETVPSPDLGQAVKRLCGMSIKEVTVE
ncbi:hypothetical protein llap_17555 [Limosa lapponica baueri]|uniref:Uncharacterized protein n=1 Tax=Limosa lapponica baueri TaxID=1758121 RepID=A0A2I0TEB1_LIMLA|nr:hypothetical protein llap_17555 [Limosa lapponica baueri]